MITVVSRSKFLSSIISLGTFLYCEDLHTLAEAGSFPLWPELPPPLKTTTSESLPFFVPSLLPFSSDVGALCFPRVLSELGQLCLHSPFLSPVFRAQSTPCFIYTVPHAELCVSLWTDLHSQPRRRLV